MVATDEAGAVALDEHGGLEVAPGDANDSHHGREQCEQTVEDGLRAFVNL